MNSTVVSRAWFGEVPYIKSWSNYYLETLGFDKILIIRCDHERFDFLDDKRIEFVDSPANDEQSILNALLNAKMPDSDYIFLCDVDEYLILQDKNISSFVEKNPQDSHFFQWALNCSVSPSPDDLRTNLELGCSVGHDGKTMFKSNMLRSIVDEHRVDMKQGAIQKNWIGDFVNQPYILHFCSRGIEDLIIRSLFQGIKVEPDKKKYKSCLETPPSRFVHLPYRFKIAYFQNNLKKTQFKTNLPSLQIDKEKLEYLFYKTKLRKDTNLFKMKYNIENLIEMYPRINFYEVAKKTKNTKFL